MNYLRWLLWPFSLLYGLVVIIRNWCYDAGWFKTTAFNFPVISVGNLTVGGAGKSPMAEYLIRLLKDSNNLATLSRGYGRNTKGFILADAQSTAATIGDEPAQFKHKFRDIAVAVCEDRVTGINVLKKDHDLIILDDAYQHRAIKPGCSILLFDYSKLNRCRLLLPAGNLREPFGGKIRADVLVVSKCPANLQQAQFAQIAAQLKPYPYQQLFFSTIIYLPLKTFHGTGNAFVVNKDATIFLLTGIAGAGPILNYLSSLSPNISHHKYPDHHRFSLKNITKLANEFLALPTTNKVIITTEKDAERLRNPALLAAVAKLNIMVLPIAIEFLNNGKQQFNNTITTYVRKYTTHNSLH